MRDHPELRRCVVRCRYCGIRFLTHPCNGGRRDLHCPFGCRKAHRRQCANRRSAKHYQTAKGRKNKKARNGQRSCRAPSGYGGTQSVGLADLARPEDSATSHSCNGELDAPINGLSNDGGQPVDLVDASATSNACRESEQPRSVKSAPALTGVEYSETASPCRGWLLLEGVLLNEASVMNSPMLSYLRMVASVLEGRTIGRNELVQALLTTMRQRSLNPRPRIDYVLDYLNRNPP